MKVTLQAAISILLALSSTKTSVAQTSAPKEKWGQWSDYTACPVTCGGGIITKQRQCTAPTPEKKCLQTRRRRCAKKPCPTPVVPETTSAIDEQTVTIMTTTIPTPPTTIAQWSEWSACDASCGSGLSVRRMSLANGPGMEEGRVCNTEPCEVTVPIGEPVPTGPPEKDMAPWGEWSVCETSCGGGMRYRDRECMDPIGRPECEGAEGEVCNTQLCEGPTPAAEPTIAGTTDDEWSEWSVCDASCGGGLSKRIKSRGSDAAEEEFRVCNSEPCEVPIPLGEPTKSPDTDVSMAQWGEWSVCEASCGGGMRYRARECMNPNARPECEDAEGEVCNTQPCEGPTPTAEPTITEMTDQGDSPGLWSDWSSCSVPCGGGERKRTRVCPPPSLLSSEGCEEEERRRCNRFPCPDVYTPWSTWSDCDESCTQFRSRVCVNDTGREDCRFFQAQRCGNESCPAEEDTYTAWSDWTPCSVTCGVGKRYRVRECTKLNGEENCEESKEEWCSLDFCTKPETTTPERSDESRDDWRKRTSREMREICGGSRVKAFRNTYQTAVSPGYPKKYKTGLDCMWTIVAPLGTRVKIVIGSFETSICCDMLTLLEGKPGGRPYEDARIATLTGNISSGAEYTSDGRFMTVRLQTGYDSPGGSYRIRFVGEETDEEEMNQETDSMDKLMWKFMRLLFSWFYNNSHN